MRNTAHVHTYARVCVCVNFFLIFLKIDFSVHCKSDTIELSNFFPRLPYEIFFFRDVFSGDLEKPPKIRAKSGGHPQKRSLNPRCVKM